MNKLPNITISKHLEEKLRLNNPKYIFSISETLTLRSLSDFPLVGDIGIIHPCTPLRQTQIIIDYLANKVFTGFLIIPHFPSKTPSFVQKQTLISTVPFSKKFFNTSEKILNNNITMRVFRLRTFTKPREVL